jgi:branched-chain amino acid transport system substrate-binding protein
LPHPPEEFHEKPEVTDRAGRGRGDPACGPARPTSPSASRISTTGPAASLGIPQKNTIDLLPRRIGGEKINWIVLDDASDTTKAVTNAQKLSREDKVDVIIGSTTRRTRSRWSTCVADAETPMISLAASARIVDPPNPKTRWVFKTPQNDALMADAIAVHMKANGVKTMGYIGFATRTATAGSRRSSARRRPRHQGRRGGEVQPRRSVGDGQVLKLVAPIPMRS